MKLFPRTALIANVLSSVAQAEIRGRNSADYGFQRNDGAVISRFFTSLIIATVLAFSTTARAGCRSDCSDRYAGGVETCQ